LGLGLIIGATAPLVSVSQARAAEFIDTRDHWAHPFIETLAQEDLLGGYSDRTFRPEQAVTRAQFSAMLQQAFSEERIALSRNFDQQAAEFWASRDFSDSGSSRTLRPSDRLSRVQVLVSLANGLRLSPRGSVADTLDFYRDASRIPDYARESIAAATQRGIIVNYPDVAFLDPRETATRGDVAAFIYQALVDEGILAPLSSRTEASQYIVRVTPETTQTAENELEEVEETEEPIAATETEPETETVEYRVPRGTSIAVQYLPSDRIVVTPGETQSLTLQVAEDIANPEGEVIIPMGSEIEGRLIPRYSGDRYMGTQFVAQRLIIGDESYNTINATSALVTGETPDEEDRPQGLGDAAINILTGILTGRSPEAEEPREEAIVIDPEEELQLSLGSDLYITKPVSAQAQ
jgi:hypothetical protein